MQISQNLIFLLRNIILLRYISFLVILPQKSPPKNLAYKFKDSIYNLLFEINLLSKKNNKYIKWQERNSTANNFC